MDLDILCLHLCGYERVGDDRYRLYVEGPVRRPSTNRRFGAKTPFFFLYAGEDAERFGAWLARNRVWMCLRVPTYDREKGVRAVLVADRWRGGDGSAIAGFGCDRVIRDEGHRNRLRHEVELLVGMVLENPVRDGELEELHELQDVVNAGPVGVKLATAAEVVAAHFGGG